MQEKEAKSENSCTALLMAAKAEIVVDTVITIELEIMIRDERYQRFVVMKRLDCFTAMIMCE
jgi:hypothetical protein